jgi:hypothetical protein
MAEHDKEDSVIESVMEKIHDHDKSSDSDSDHGKPKSESDSLKSKIYRIFGREKPVHKVLGGGKRMFSFFITFNRFLVYVVLVCEMFGPRIGKLFQCIFLNF